MVVTPWCVPAVVDRLASGTAIAVDRRESLSLGAALYDAARRMPVEPTAGGVCRIRLRMTGRGHGPGGGVLAVHPASGGVASAPAAPAADAPAGWLGHRVYWSSSPPSAGPPPLRTVRLIADDGRRWGCGWLGDVAIAAASVAVEAFSERASCRGLT